MKKKIVKLLTAIFVSAFFAFGLSSCQLLEQIKDHLDMSSTTVDSSEHIHAFGEWKVETPASCTAAGVEIRESE